MDYHSVWLLNSQQRRPSMPGLTSNLPSTLPPQASRSSDRVRRLRSRQVQPGRQVRVMGVRTLNPYHFPFHPCPLPLKFNLQFLYPTSQLEVQTLHFPQFGFEPLDSCRKSFDPFREVIDGKLLAMADEPLNIRNVRKKVLDQPNGPIRSLVIKFVNLPLRQHEGELTGKSFLTDGAKMTFICRLFSGD